MSDYIQAFVVPREWPINISQVYGWTTGLDRVTPYSCSVPYTASPHFTRMAGG
jgi:hypothetical protein